MSQEVLYPAKRRAQILDYLREHGHASTQELISRFDVSGDTIRRDVQALAEGGTVARTHGGVTLSSEELLAHTIPFVRRVSARTDAKDRIAHAAASLVDDYQSVVINGGTTTLALAGHLAERRGLTVVTNNLPLVPELVTRGIDEVYVLGGQFRPSSQVTIGPMVLSAGSGAPRPIHADCAIIGIGGVTDDGRVWTSSLPEAGMMREMVECASQAVLLADSTKFGRREFAEVGRLSSRTTLVTDTAPADSFVDCVREAGARLMIASHHAGEVES